MSAKKSRVHTKPRRTHIEPKGNKSDKSSNSRANAISRQKSGRVMTYISALALTVLTILYFCIPSVKSATLPLRIYIDEKNLENLPIIVDNVASCGCWSGERSQAVKKYKFRLRNTGSYPINIGGGTESSIKLLVAYPKDFAPRLTLPFSDRTKSVTAEVPNDVNLYVGDRIENVDSTKIATSSDIFGVPEGYNVWALPALSANIVETTGNASTYPTVVDKEVLAPGESYYSTDLGHGDWVFYTPLNPSFAERFNSVFEWVPPPELIAKNIVLIGIGVFSPYASHEMIGFAPAPPMSSVLSPSAF